MLVDNTILPLSGLDGDQWARDLYTVERIVCLAFVVVGFNIWYVVLKYICSDLSKMATSFCLLLLLLVGYTSQQEGEFKMTLVSNLQ